MAITINARGTSVPFFTIGKNGTTLYQGSVDPSLIYTMKNGDVWLDASANKFSSWSSTNSNWQAPSIANLAFTGSTISAATSTDLTLKTTSGNNVVIDAGAGNPVITGPAGKDLYISDPIGGNLYLNTTKWPTADGTANQVLTTDGSGNLSWTSVLAPTSVSVSTKTSNYTIGTSDGLILANGAITITLPSAVSFANRTFKIKRISDAGPVYVESASGTIDGETQIQITAKYASITVVSDGTNWWII